MATESLSELLRRYRTRAGLTQAALADKAGLSEQAISVLERGTRRRPRNETVRALTAVLGLNAEEAATFTAAARSKRRTARTTAPEPRPAAEADSLPIPWQLPPAIADFTGRAAQIEAILSALRVPANPRSDTVGLVAVSGMGGIGKTALAIQAAHKLVDSYPDGHLYLNLRGYGPGLPMTTADALGQLLRSLRVDLRLVPEGVEEAAALLRSQLAGRRVLVVLDNATDVPHVLPLLPGSPGSAAIITSRESMATLPGARQMRLDALSGSEAVEMLSGVVGAERIGAEPDAADSLTLLTGRLPLAVRLTGARLAARPTWPIRYLVDLLQDEGRRLDGLGSDETGVRASIASSVHFLETSNRGLDREAARAVPMLSVPDGSNLLTVVAAHLLDVPVQRADAILERLVDLNLMDCVAPERYRFHDLIRTYGRELADQSLTAAERDAGLERILRFYIGCAWRCHALIHDTSPRLALATIQIEPFPALGDVDSALHWFDDEQRNLMDRFAQAAGTTLAGSMLFPELALALFGYHEPRGRWAEMREVGRGVVELAVRFGQPSMAAWLEHDSAIPEVENGDLESAVTHLFKALEMFRVQSDTIGLARCCSSLTYVLGHHGRIEEALEFGNEALRLSQELGDPTLEGVSYAAVGGLYNRAGDHTRADEAFQRGIALAETSDDTRLIYKKHINVAFSHLLVGRYRDAVEYAQRSLAIAEQAGNGLGVIESHQILTLGWAAQGDYETALRHAEGALAFARRVKNTIREGRLLLEMARINAAMGDRSTATANATAAAAVLAAVSPLHATYANELLALLQRGDLYTYSFTTHSI
ncbi:helix-turn-helix domain-containing protein [Kribbella turkmenica]|uniref:Helix-turn-helix domain-containing protein n=1 Tax=Kribbella turkmenica TaxID=2530375 RepID=A0A4R4WUN5_9ACTN|nr:helix-turn-helix domain-containing protein [Kribbella turkmenica]TDD21366.1 helix-turn-helix domain-containing protein [Kribbella turkmenica]